MGRGGEPMLACDWSKQKQAITKPSGEEVISHPKTCSSLRSCLSECVRSDTDVPPKQTKQTNQEREKISIIEQ